MTATQQSIWLNEGSDTHYEYYRTSSETFAIDFRNWVDDAYYNQGLSEYLDIDFVTLFSNHDFYARLWELEIAECLSKLGFTLVPTNGVGPDFKIELSNGNHVWIEATLARASDGLLALQAEALANSRQAFDTPRDETALRFTTRLFDKSDKFKNSYAELIGPDDYSVIAISALPPSQIRNNIDMFIRAILPIDNPVIHFSTDGRPLDESIQRPTHSFLDNFTRSSGQTVPKTFLLPGSDDSHIDGVLFSEASNLQQLLGSASSRFNESTNHPHFFENYSGKRLPDEFTNAFYYHKFTDSQLQQINPTRTLQ